jgi:hypothetical protein
MQDIILLIIFFVFGLYSTVGIKTQFVRLIDVFIYGPFFIYLGFYRAKNIYEKLGLFFVGATTISYNLKNYLYIRDKNIDENKKNKII